MPDSVNTSTPSAPISESDSLDLGMIFKQSMAFGVDAQKSDLIRDARADGRFHHVLDRSFLNRYLSATESVPQEVGELNTTSHIPFSQPWYPPTVPAQ